MLTADMENVRSLRSVASTIALILLNGTGAWAASGAVVTSQDFGTLQVNSVTPEAITITYQAGALAGPPSFTLQYHSDFSLGMTNCSGSPNLTCTVPTLFSPKYSGLRQDAIRVLDGSGNLLATINLHGIGLGPQAFVSPGVSSLVASSVVWPNPQGLALDQGGNLYISDSIDGVVRRVSAINGSVTTVAGGGSIGSPGDGGPATSANLNAPSGICVDAAGNLYIADGGNNRVRKVDALSGYISTIAGTGSSSDPLGDGGPAANASLYNPSDVAVDPAGNLYIADTYRNRIRKVDVLGIITTLAGGGSPTPGTDGLGNGGLAINSQLSRPAGVALDAAGTLYIADTGNHLVRKVNSGIISVVAGDGGLNYPGDGGLATNASLVEPTSVRLDAAGDVFIADKNDSAIRQVNGAGIISTVATGPLQFPTSVAVDPSGNLYIADQGNRVVRSITSWIGSLGFPNTNIGDISTPQIVSVSNVGNGALLFSAFNVSGNFVQQSSGSADCSPLAVVAPANSCEIAVAFAPQSAGAISGTLKFNTSSVPLSGAGIGTPGTTPTASTASLVFNNQAIGVTSSAQVVILSNPGAASLAVSASISGSEALDFTLTPKTCTAAPHGGTCTFSVAFTPGGTGLRSATLTLLEGSSPAFSQSVFLSGTTSVAPPVVSPTNLSFSNQGLGSLPVTQTIIVSNPNAAALTIASISLSGSADYAVSTTCQSTLQKNGNCTISVTFTPTASGTEMAAIAISGLGGTFSQSVSLTTNNPPFAFTTSTSAAITQARGRTSVPLAILLKNLSAGPLNPSSITIGGTNSADFGQVNDCSSVGAGQGCMIWVTYSPSWTSPATSLASVIVNDNLPGSPRSIPISGNATGLSQARISVDTPSPNSSVSGTIPLGGWAISDNATITGVKVAVDGVAISQAAYGNPRPDVCTVYPGRSGCPNVGWWSSLITTELADGPHQLQVTTSSTQGYTTFTVPFVVANLTNFATRTTKIAIDQPGSSTSRLSGTASLFGWAIDDKAAISGITVSVDGVAVKPANYGGTRPDVCTVYPGRSGCPNVGWYAALDTTQLPDGNHVLSITAQTTDSRFSTATANFSVSNASTSPVLVDIDSPGVGSVTGVLEAVGWAVDRGAPISSVQILVDGVSQGVASIMSRSDVCAAFLTPPGCPNVGWYAPVDTTQLADGQHTLSVVATASDSHRFTIAKPFTVSNTHDPNANTIVTWIDQPNTASGALSGQVLVSGWAVDQVTTIANIEFVVDGVPFGNAQGMFARPDVCTIYAGALNCPNAGWYGFLDTTKLADGPHTFEVVATSEQGRNAIRTVRFVSSNASLWSSKGEVVWMDAPSGTSPVSGQISVIGWAVNSQNNVQGISIAVDGVVFGTAQYGGYRPDVCGAFTSPLNCPNVGWFFTLDTRLLSNGIHTIQAIETAQGGNANYSRTITVSNSSASMRLCIDFPSPVGQYSGVAQFGGWAVNSTSSVQTVIASVDGRPIGVATYGGSRPDVCNIYPGSGGCPNVGWGFSLDTTQLNNAAHIFAITAISSTGEKATISNPFVSAN